MTGSARAKNRKKGSDGMYCLFENKVPFIPLFW